MIDLPIPSVSEVGDYNTFTPANFGIPVGYVRRKIPFSEEPETHTEYDLDFDDEVRAC